jgi:sporulation protein YlmC with PRC-barrel domain
MKILLATASAFALIASATACTPSDTPYNNDADTAVTVDKVADDTSSDVAVDTASAMNYTLATGEHEASDLIGASVHSPSGKEIATVADIWFGAAGSAPMFVLRDGGELRTVAYSATTIRQDATTSGEEPNVIVALSDETVASLPAFEQAKDDDFRLASEMIGASVDIAVNGESGRINDLILSNSGEARYAILAPNLTTTDQLVVDAKAITVAQGDADGELVLDIDARAFAAAPAYPRE